jgi:hypothetical protein
MFAVVAHSRAAEHMRVSMIRSPCPAPAPHSTPQSSASWCSGALTRSCATTLSAGCPLGAAPCFGSGSSSGGRAPACGEKPLPSPATSCHLRNCMQTGQQERQQGALDCVARAVPFPHALSARLPSNNVSGGLLTAYARGRACVGAVCCGRAGAQSHVHFPASRFQHGIATLLVHKLIVY